MRAQTFNDPLGKITPIVREIYEAAEVSGDMAIKAKCLRLYVEIAAARKALGLEEVPVGLLHDSGRA